MIRLGIYATLVAGVIASVWFYGRSQYKAGASDTVQAYVQADKEGSDDIHEVSEQILRDVVGIDDPDELLLRTGGLRD